MKTKTKLHIDKLCISSQVANRPTKNAKGMCYTNERRARRTNNSFLYAAFVDKRRYTQTNEARTLSVKGTLDRLACVNSVTKFKFKKYRKSLAAKNSTIKVKKA